MRPARILVIEPDESVRLAAASALSAAGYELRIATTGAQALAGVEAREPDLIVADADLARRVFYAELKNAITRVAQLNELMGDRSGRVTPRIGRRSAVPDLP